MTTQLKPKDVAPFRAELLKRQANRCALCTRYIRPDQAALDHDHVKGNVRSVLHSNCNGVEGRILQWARRSGCDPLLFLKQLVQYWGHDYSHMPLHPNHLTEDQKKIKLYKRRLESAKKEQTKAKYRRLIKELKA
jgi:hypothetical protein